MTHCAMPKKYVCVQLEGKLEEILVLCQRAEEYNQFMLAKAAEAAKPKLLPTSHENAFRSGAFNTSIRELSSYYINMVKIPLPPGYPPNPPRTVTPPKDCCGDPIWPSLTPSMSIT